MNFVIALIIGIAIAGHSHSQEKPPMPKEYYKLQQIEEQGLAREQNALRRAERRKEEAEKAQSQGYDARAWRKWVKTWNMIDRKNQIKKRTMNKKCKVDNQLQGC